MAGTIKTTFINDDLDAEYSLVWAHNKSTTNVLPTWFDETGENRNGPNVFTVVDQNNIKINCGGPVSGTQEIVLFYDDTVSTTGRRLFELTIPSSIDDTYRIALGKADTASINLTYGDFRDTIKNELGDQYFIISNYFNEFSGATSTEKQQARANLGVSSTDRVTTKSEVEALLTSYIQNNGALSDANSFSLTNSYSPSVASNLATKGYADSINQPSNLLTKYNLGISNFKVAQIDTVTNGFALKSDYIFQFGGTITMTSGAVANTEYRFCKIQNFDTGGTSAPRFFPATDTVESNHEAALIKVIQNGADLDFFITPGKSGAQTYNFSGIFLLLNNDIS